MAEAKPATKAADQAGARKERRGVMIAAAAAIAAIGAGGAGWFFVAGPGAGAVAGAEGSASAADLRRGPPQYLPIDPLTVNLQDEDSGHYLQIGLTLQMADAKTSERVKTNLPVIRNSLLLLLSSKSVRELRSVEGKEQLQKEILAAARGPMPGNGPDKGIEGVLFSQFVIQ
jgi:flagellar FliL protein